MITLDVHNPIENVQETRRSTIQWCDVQGVGGFSRSKVESIKSLFELKNLPANWDGYGSPPLSTNALSTALSLFLTDIEDLPAPRISPVSGGGVQLIWRIGGRELDLEALADGSIEYLEVQDNLTVEEGELTNLYFGEFQQLFDWLRWG